jgi:hypothetical protein
LPFLIIFDKKIRSYFTVKKIFGFWYIPIAGSGGVLTPIQLMLISGFFFPGESIEAGSSIAEKISRLGSAGSRSFGSIPDWTFYEGFLKSGGDSGSEGLKCCLGFSQGDKGLWASRDFSVKLWDFWGGREKGLGVGSVWLFIGSF